MSVHALFKGPPPFHTPPWKLFVLFLSILHVYIFELMMLKKKKKKVETDIICSLF